jgi:hypothetical protein
MTPQNQQHTDPQDSPDYRPLGVLIGLLMLVIASLATVPQTSF